jgi:DNA-binding response OmpR family regulator
VAHLLLVEDDAAIAEALHLALSDLGHVVRVASTGEEGLAVLGTPTSPDRPDLAIVDVMLPGIDGFEVCRKVSATNGPPIVLLTARSDPIDIVVGLECGADDYVTKPVEPRVLDARIKAVLRRATPSTVVADRRIEVGSLVVDESAMVVTRHGDTVSLTPTELRLFLELLHHAGQAMTRRVLLERVWDYGYVGDARLVDACVQRLRAKVEDDPGNPTMITTVRGVGYRLDRR